jgi:hypothetical protein
MYTVIYLIRGAEPGEQLVQEDFQDSPQAFGYAKKCWEAGQHVTVYGEDGSLVRTSEWLES